MATTAGIGDLTRYNLAPRKRGRVVDCTGLENRRLERVREFESHRFRQMAAQGYPSITDVQRPRGAFFMATRLFTVPQW